MSALLRIVIGLLVAAALAVAVVPVLVVLDLNDGGTGWGLCQGGLDACENSYFAGPELLAAGFVVLAALLLLIRGATLLLRKVERAGRRRELAS